jgi:GNAT superfamily N-acetyltransferase
MALLAEWGAHQGEPFAGIGARGPNHDVLGRDLFGPRAAAHVLVADLDGGLEAVALLVPAYDAVRGVRGFSMTAFHVTERARARGVSAALLAACAAFAQTKGAAFLWWVSKAWDVETHDFFRKIGVREEPVMAHMLPEAAFGKLAAEGAAHLLPPKKPRAKSKP